jgi:dihydrofolate reductase
MDFQTISPPYKILISLSNTHKHDSLVTTMSNPQQHTMPPTKTPLTLIVAATPKNGIGKNGALPWPMLKKEMAYFARVTKRVPTSTSTTSSNPSKAEDEQAKPLPRNAVIMGRKTWDSIPPKFRPLKDRTNIVISSQERGALSGVTVDVIVSSSILEGLSSLEAAVKDGRAPPLSRAYVIGGARIYDAAMELEQTRHVLLTRVAREYECDTFFPDLEGSERWVKKERGELEGFVGEEVVEGGLEEEGVKYEFQLWERV